MKKGERKNLIKWIIIGVAVLLLIFIVYKVFTGFVPSGGIPPSNDSYCTDSDGGKDYYIRGTTNDSHGSRLTDYCTNSASTSLLIEGYCNVVSSSYSIESYESYACPNGCSEGVCINDSSVIPSNQSCTDSDGGANPYQAGHVYGINPEGKNYILNDTCNNSSDGEWIYERTCVGSPLKVASYTTPLCPYGCKDGACMNASSTDRNISNTPTRSCVDSDGGKDYYVAGTTYIPNPYSDLCLDNKTLRENYCEGTYPASINYICPNECSRNACVNVSSVIESVPTQQETICVGGMKHKICNINYNGTYYGYYYFYCGDNNSTCPSETGIIGVTCAQNVSSGNLASLCIKYSEDVFSCHDTWFCPSPGSSTAPPTIVNNTQVCTYGCLYDDKCLPYGYRIGSNYCNINTNILINQINDGACENNFECISNVCANSECISPSFLQQIINFLKNLFGIQ